jgi:hypothetical protein
MRLKPGTRLRSQVDTTEIIVVRSGDGEPQIACGGHPMIDGQSTPGAGISPAGQPGEGTKLGKRYTAAGDDGLELLVTKSGSWCLTVGGVPVALKEAKPLPASD